MEEEEKNRLEYRIQRLEAIVKEHLAVRVSRLEEIAKRLYAGLVEVRKTAAAIDAKTKDQTE